MFKLIEVLKVEGSCDNWKYDKNPTEYETYNWIAALSKVIEVQCSVLQQSTYWHVNVHLTEENQVKIPYCLLYQLIIYYIL
jgi:hypothetical protein